MHCLIKNPASVTDHDTDLKACMTKKVFCITYKNQTRESAVTVCIKKNGLFARFTQYVTCLLCWKFCNCLYCFFLQIHHILKHRNVRIEMVMETAIVYKAPVQPSGKIIFATAAAAWQNGAQPLNSNAQHSFATALQHVVGDNPNVKFLAYNNAPPGVANVKTKSNSKGVIILATNADSAAWIVHTVPGFPAAKTGYNWPLAENARGHLLICLTISESQINAIGLYFYYSAYILI
ncbi:Deoxyribonuclease-2-alpha, partial [Trichinella britovi]